MAEGPEGRAASVRGVSEHYLEALLRGDVEAARELAESALARGATLQDIYLFVFQPALYEIGRLWQEGQATVAQEHLATASTQALMARLSQGSGSTADRDRRGVVTSTESDLHALGARFVADFLRTEGWSVLELGADTPTHDLQALVSQLRPALVCLSTTLSINLPHAEQAIASLRELTDPPLIVVGGQAYGGDTELARRMGADLFAADAAALLDELAARLGGSAQR